MGKKCILDSSSAILLFKAGIIDYLLSEYSVACPESVYSEITRNREYPGARSFINFTNNGLISVRSINNNYHLLPDKKIGNLGKGESDCIRLYYQEDGDFIILDDKRGGNYCRKANIPFINALLVPRILFLSKLFSDNEYEARFNNIISEGRYSHDIKNYASKVDSKELAFFMP